MEQPESIEGNREINNQSVLSYGGILMPKTNGATPSPKTPFPEKEKTKFSKKFKGIFGKKTNDSFNDSPQPEERIDEPQAIETLQAAETIIDKNNDIPSIEEDSTSVDKDLQEEKDKNARNKFAMLFHLNRKKEPTDVNIQVNPGTEDRVIESPDYGEDDELQTRNVNESKVGFADLPDPVLIATHSKERKNSAQSISSVKSEKKSTLSWLLLKTWQFIKFFLKQISLVGVILAYAIAGSFAFQLLEQHNEQRSCQESKGADIANVVLMKAKLIEYVQFNITSNPMDTTKDNETYAVQRIEEMLTEYRDEVLSIGYDGSDCADTKWIPINGILFCLTVVTTIGYGHVFPVTWEGQIFCIVYATIGIPLFIMCTANISTVLGFLFRWTYVKVCCGYCNHKKKKEAKRLEENSKDLPDIDATSPTSSANSPDFDTSQAQIVDDNEDIENEMSDKDDIENVSVPLTVTILTITFYIGFGALIFHFFEGWLIIESAYFCFVTLSTIGFGDFTPGQNFDDPLLTLKLGAGCIYILLGLALLGMAFDLMQEELISKFSWFGKKIGLLESDEDEEEDEKEKSSLKDSNEKEKEDEVKSNDYSRQVTMNTEKEN